MNDKILIKDKNIKNIPKDNIVIVLDVSNYKSSYAESTPFRAVILNKFENEVVVESLESGKEYELYYYQILKFLPKEELMDIIVNGMKKI